MKVEVCVMEFWALERTRDLGMESLWFRFGSRDTEHLVLLCQNFFLLGYSDPHHLHDLPLDWKILTN